MPASSLRPAKRRNVSQACDTCKIRKRRCDGYDPCVYCSERRKPCTYNNEDHRTRRHLSNSNEEHRTRRQVTTARRTEEEATAPEANTTLAAAGSSRQSRAQTPSADALISPGQYVGPSSPFWFLRRALRLSNIRAREADITPNTSIYTRGDRTAVVSVDAHAVSLPSPEESDSLLSHYFDFATPTYRFYHKPTVQRWMSCAYDAQSSISDTHLAAVYIILATACLYASSRSAQDSGCDARWHRAEGYFQKSQELLADERGKIALVSVQARLSSCLFLLNTSRANQAWFDFGTVVQLCLALGLHSRDRPTDRVMDQCRKRTFWSTYTLDVYLSLMLGRPSMLHDDDITQREADFVNDEEIGEGQPDMVDDMPADCISAAAILHARLAKILKRASREQSKTSDLSTRSAAKHSQVFDELNIQLTAWQKDLPVYLSGAIRPSSLIPILARQHSLLQMAHAHTVMVVNRPFLLQPAGNTQPTHDANAKRCVDAAKLAIDLMRRVYTRRPFLPAFWYFQYIIFTALSIVYVDVICCQQRRQQDHEQIQETLRSAAEVQQSLTAATSDHAPGLRYGAILEGLQEEAQRCLASGHHPSQQIHDDGPPNALDVTEPHLQSLDPALDPDKSTYDDTFPFMSVGTEQDSDLDFWSLLETMPFGIT